MNREGAIFHVFERLGRQRYEGLDRELREIMKERGPREADPFDELLDRSACAGYEGARRLRGFGGPRRRIDWLWTCPLLRANCPSGFLQGTLMGATPVSHGAALPHMRSNLLDHSFVLLARVKKGVRFGDDARGVGQDVDEPVRAVFFIVSPEADPGRHLRILAQIARRVDQESFMQEWLGAASEEELKEALFRNERMLVMTLARDQSGSDLIGLQLRELSLPDGTLIAMLRRGDELVFPRGDTALFEGDRITVIGRADGISVLRERYEVTIR